GGWFHSTRVRWNRSGACHYPATGRNAGWQAVGAKRAWARIGLYSGPARCVRRGSGGKGIRRWREPGTERTNSRTNWQQNEALLFLGMNRRRGLWYTNQITLNLCSDQGVPCVLWSGAMGASA